MSDLKLKCALGSRTYQLFLGFQISQLSNRTKATHNNRHNYTHGMFIIVYCLDDKVTLDFGRALQQGRMSKSWTQKDLATVSPWLYCWHMCVRTYTICMPVPAPLTLSLVHNI